MTLLNNVPDFNGKIVNALTFDKLCLVAWGGLRVGGSVTVHLPKDLMWNGGGGMGATYACMPKAGLGLTWTFDFGYEGWEGAVLCRRCFDYKKQKPKHTHRPPNGWWSYAKTPKDETVFKTKYPSLQERKVAVVNKLLAMNRYDEILVSTDEGAARIVEV